VLEEIDTGFQIKRQYESQHPLACCCNNKSMPLLLIEVKEGEDLQNRFVNASLRIALFHAILYQNTLPLASRNSCNNG
jgi:hypothetical protein